MTLVYDSMGNEFKVPHLIDLKGWIDSGYTLNDPKGKQPEKAPKK